MASITISFDGELGSSRKKARVTAAHLLRRVAFKIEEEGEEWGSVFFRIEGRQASGYFTTNRLLIGDDGTRPAASAGIDELRSVVAWANGEDENRWQPEFGKPPSLEAIVEQFRDARREDEERRAELALRHRVAERHDGKME